MVNRWIRRGAPWVLTAAFVWLIISQFAEITLVHKTLVQGRWPWVLAAVILQVAYYCCLTMVYQHSFAMVGIPSRLRRLLPVMISSLFANVVVPSGGIAGSVLFVDNAGLQGHSRTRATAGVLLALLANYGAFALALVAGLGYLFTQSCLTPYEIVGAAVLMLITGGLGGILLLGLWRPELLRLVTGWLGIVINFLARRFHLWGSLADDWAAKTATEFHEAAFAVKSNPGRVTRLLIIAAASHGWDMASLYALFIAFHQPINLGALVAGYSMGILFWIVSPTPQGIGVVEGVMALVYTSVGVPKSVAIVVALAFRGLTFWLPLALGLFALRRLKSFKSKEKSDQKSGVFA